MITPGEIQQKARTVGVRDQQIEKDYILSWILFGIAGHTRLSEAIVFKGGTVLKKVYFPDYRFSEDLDFTLLHGEANNELLFSCFNEVFAFILEESNIPLEIIDHNEHEDGGLNFYVSYTGPLGGKGNHKRVKIDISRSEQMEFVPVWRDAYIDYSDLEAYKLMCYSLEEVLVEKMRSVMQRMQARDFYDIWYLLEVHGLQVDAYLSEFRSKCRSKGLLPTDFASKLTDRIPQYKGRWQNSLSEQIKNLPDFETVEREAQRHLRGLIF